MEAPRPVVGRPLVEMTGISVAFGPVQALDSVDLRLYPGEVHALMGENGAGKSTLIKALTGVHPVDAGQIQVQGEPVAFSGPAAAQAAGISTVYQEVNLCPNLSVAENLLLGREPRRAGRIDWRGARRRATEVLGRLHLDLDPSSPLGAPSSSWWRSRAPSRWTPGCSFSTSPRPAWTRARSRSSSGWSAGCVTTAWRSCSSRTSSSRSTRSPTG
jgi:simple sugar transport system ATP-binding protein